MAVLRTEPLVEIRRIASHGSGQKNLKGKGRTATEACRNCMAVARECLPDMEERGPASEGNAAVGGGTGRRVERESRRWRAAPCTAAAEGRRTDGRRK
jgi:hypothetical protein